MNKYLTIYIIEFFYQVKHRSSKNKKTGMKAETYTNAKYTRVTAKQCSIIPAHDPDIQSVALQVHPL